MRAESDTHPPSLSPHPFIIGSVTVQTPTPAATEQGPSFTLNDLLIYAAKQQASDLHLKPMRPPLVRIHGKLVPIKTEPLKPADLEKMLLRFSIGRSARSSTRCSRSTSATACPA